MHYYVYNSPLDEVYNETPVRFSWMPVDERSTYSISVFKEADEKELCYQFEGIDINFYTPDVTMQSGTYYWCLYGEHGKLFGPQKFTIAEDAANTPLPKRAGRYDALTDHPRILFNKRQCEELKERVTTDLKEDFEAFLNKSVEKFVEMPVHNEPPRYPDDIRDIPMWRQNYTMCQECLYAVRHSVFAYKATGDEKYKINAKRWLMAIVGWDLKGSTARTYNDECGFRVTTALAWGYDWLHDELEEDEKALIKACLLERARELYNYVKNEIQIHIKLLDSHGVRSISMTLVPAALALYGEEKEAEDWLNYSIEYYMTLYTPWGGGEGGWAEGPAYWQTGMAFVFDALNMIKKALNIDIFERPFFQNTGDYPLFTYCQDLRYMAFGDMSDLGDYPQLKAGYILRFLAAVSKNKNSGYYQWYYNQAKKRNVGKEHFFYNYSWWNFDFDNIVFKFDYSEAEEKIPTDDTMVKWFKDVGWVLVHKNMTKEDEHIALMFKSSPYGTVSHSHGDQNAFVLHAYGEPLAIQTGYYIGFWSEMHLKWRRQTKSKNSILIDGVGQFAELRKTSKAEELNGSAKSQFEALMAANGTVEEVSQNGDNVYIRGNANNAYKQTVPYLKNYTRHIHFLGGNSIIIIDEIDLEKEGAVNWLIHGLRKFDIKDNGFVLNGEKASMKGTFINVSSGNMTIDQNDLFEGVAEAELEGLENQWHLCATTEKAKSHRIVTLLEIYKNAGC